MALRATISIELLQASVSSARTTTSVTYELSQATGIWTDPDSNNRMVKDEFPLSDVRFNLVEKNLTESIPLVDVSAYDFNALKEDSFTFADTFVNVVAYKRHFTDAFTLDDLSQIDKDFYGNKGNIFNFTDIVGLTYNKVFEDDYTVSDVVSVVTAFKRNFTDNVTPGDTTNLDVSKISYDDFVFADSQAKAYSKATTDIFGFTDTSFADQHLHKADDFSLSELYLTAITKHVTDAFVLDDATQVNKDYSGNKGNLVAFTDVLSRVLQYKRAFSETLTFTETHSTALSKTLNDNFTVFDDPVLNSALNSHTLNTQSLNGAANIYTGHSSINRDVNTGPTDGLAFSELSAVSASKVATDTLSVADESYLAIRNNQGDLINIGDNYASSTTKVETDSFSTTEEINKGLSKTLDNPVNIHDILATTINKNVTDAFTLDDSALVDKDYYGNKGNIVGMSDVVTVTRVARRLLNGAPLNRTQIN